VGAGAYSLRFQYRPLIRFVWLGAFIMAMGGVTVVFGRRQRGAGWVEQTERSSVATDPGSA
jgi:cytochrome c-type biogenesis protein CcmF